jgi:hypothetical protein
MPTILKRTNVTHVPALAEALRVGRGEWPDIATSDAAIIVRLAERGADALRVDHVGDADRLTALVAEAGSWASGFTDTYLDEVREGWDE